MAVPEKKLNEVKAALVKVVSANYAGKSPTVNTRHEQAPLGLWYVTAAVEHAYPGSGIARVLIDEQGVTYGRHGEKDLADLVRARGWLVKDTPDAMTLRKLVDLALFEGVVMTVDEKPTTLAKKDGGLVLTFYQTWHPSGGLGRIDVELPAAGKAILTQKTEK